MERERGGVRGEKIKRGQRRRKKQVSASIYGGHHTGNGKGEKPKARTRRCGTRRLPTVSRTSLNHARSAASVAWR